MKYEYRYREQGNEWEMFEGKAYDQYQVAEEVAEEYWDNGDGGDANRFEFEVEVREMEKPETEVKLVVTADYSINFYAHDVK